MSPQSALLGFTDNLLQTFPSFLFKRMYFSHPACIHCLTDSKLTNVLLLKFTSQVSLYKCCFASSTVTDQYQLKTIK